MNNRHRSKAFLPAAFAFLSILTVVQPARGQVLSASIQRLQMTKRERIVGFEIHISSGRVVSLPSVPAGWQISIDDDPSWNTVMKGSSTVGAAALGPDFFRDFVIIEKDKSLGLQFEAKGELVVTEDFEHERRISLSTKDFVLKKSRAMAAQP